MLDHFFVSCDGALHDTRNPNWSREPLRPNYRMTHQRIESVADYKATLRAGRFAWPGGYPTYLITSDCAALCFACARKEARNIIDDIRDSLRRGSRGRYSWRVVATDINYEDSELYCDHCSERIESAYAEPEIPGGWQR